MPEPPPLRSGFLSYAEAREIVARHPEWEHGLRSDLQNVELLGHAAAAGCRISIGTDAHTPDELHVIWIGVAAAISAGLQREQILNYMDRRALLDWVRERRAAA